MTAEQKAKYKQIFSRAYNWLGHTEAVTGHLRYEVVRKLNARQFAALCARNQAGEGAFDDLVDLMVADGD